MADRYPAFLVTIPAQTPANAPVRRPVIFPAGTVVEIELRVPAGAAGLVGFALAQAGQQVIPENADGIYVADNEVLRFEVADTLRNGDWQVIGYNTDVYDHRLNVRFAVNNNAAPASAAPGAEQLDLSTLSG
jgi:hypothetical protein